MGTNSLMVEAVDTSGNPLANMKVYIKGGYKKYTLTSNTAYYYDNLSPSDNRLVTDAGGLAAVSNLVPGGYYFCGDAGATSCAIGGTTYYLLAALPYGGNSPFSPIIVPTYNASSPPAVTYPYGANSYLQKVRLIFGTSSSTPRVTTMTSYEASQSGSPMGAFVFQLTGVNMPCSASASSCSTKVELLQNTTPTQASCTGNSSGVQLNCTINLSGAPLGWTRLRVTYGSQVVTMPLPPPLGGINVVP
jgi:hypothetical protein